MMANLDTDGIWHIVQDGLVYGINVLSAALHNDVLNSLLHVLGHLPWIADYHAYLPFFAKSVRRFRAFAIQCATVRFKDGSPYKDLFHYLVRFQTFVVPLATNTQFHRWMRRAYRSSSQAQPRSFLMEDSLSLPDQTPRRPLSAVYSGAFCAIQKRMRAFGPRWTPSAPTI